MSKKKHLPLQKLDSLFSVLIGIVLVIVVGILTYSIVANVRQTTHLQETLKNEEQRVPTTHRVVDGETLWDIALRYYESGYNWVDIAQTNSLANPNALSVGQELIIPDVPKILVESGDILDGVSTDQEKPKHVEVTVVEGDSLWSIAEREYGTGYKWVDIAKANSIVSNPDLIYPNTILRLP